MLSLMSTPVVVDAELAAFLESQPVFFVATAPASLDGRINCSPKGNDASLRVTGNDRLAFVDYTGSGAETTAHLRENGRITLMFASFSERPQIIRIYGIGTVHEVNTHGFAELAHHFQNLHGARSIIEVEISEARKSCGFGVPTANSLDTRTTMRDWLDAKGDEGLSSYRTRHNRVSIDGLPAFGPA